MVLYVPRLLNTILYTPRLLETILYVPILLETVLYIPIFLYVPILLETVFCAPILLKTILHVPILLETVSCALSLLDSGPFRASDCFRGGGSDTRQENVEGSPAQRRIQRLLKKIVSGFSFTTFNIVIPARFSSRPGTNPLRCSQQRCGCAQYTAPTPNTQPPSPNLIQRMDLDQCSFMLIERRLIRPALTSIRHGNPFTNPVL